MKRLLLLLSFLPILASGGDGHCKRFTIWNPSTNDTIYHFYRGKGQHGDCWYDYHMIGNRVEFHCENNEGTPRTGEAVVLRPLCLAENPTVDDRPLDLKSSGAAMREIQLVAPGVTEPHRSLAGG